MKYEHKLEKEMMCPIEYGLDIFGGKWKSRIICVLSVKECMRYNEIRKELGNITDAVLAAMLKELIEADMIDRKQYNEIPPKVEYTLTSKGKSIVPILQQFANWGATNMQEKSTCGLSCKECRKIK